MSFISPGDMVDEDAADLQFPKDCEDDKVVTLVPDSSTKYVLQYQYLSDDDTDNDLNSLPVCSTCPDFLGEPYVKCAECSSLLCLNCFSKGKETKFHSSSHSYMIIHDNIEVFPNSKWTAREELKFLDLILSKGFGNWEEISMKMGSRSVDECRKHYESCYFDGVFKSLGLTNDIYISETVPYNFKMNSADPPRYNYDSVQFPNMAGYRAARGDFDVPYDNSAESIIAKVDLNDWPSNWKNISDELHCAIFRAYNHRLKERHRRYKIMREHGLIVANRVHAYFKRYTEALNPIKNSKSLGRFSTFMQITSGSKFSSILESLQLFIDYKKYLFKLYNLRENGITSFCGGNVFNKLKNKRQINSGRKKSEKYENILDWRALVGEKEPICLYGTSNLFSSSHKRRNAAPLDVTGLPCYSQLTCEEKELCSKVRLTPTAYLDYKNILENENSKAGYLRLSDARRLIKIDVNKTRRLYDFLLEHGFINAPYS